MLYATASVSHVATSGTAVPPTADVVVSMLGSQGIGVASRLARSLRESGSLASLVMIFVGSPATVAVAAAVRDEWRVTPFFVNASVPPYARMRGHRDKLIRYWAAARYLTAHAAEHRGGRVMLADSRDVVFQRDPFTIPPDPAQPLDVFFEDYLRDFGNSKINQGHVVPCFGEAAVRRVLLSPAPRPVACSGVTLGSFDAVLWYARAMWAEMGRPQYSARCLEHDQAFHNFLLHAGRLGAVRAFSNERGPVHHIGWPQHLYRDRFGRVLNRAGDVVHVVHQFDRRRRLLGTLGSRYALIDRPEPPPRDGAPVDTVAAFLRGRGSSSNATYGGTPL